MGKYFGTDGIRGVAFEKLNAELAFRVGQAISNVLKSSTVVIGMDTRESSPMLAYSIANGILSSGYDVLFAGVVSTPMIAHYSKKNGLVGVMITASHNPFMDNGIKVFNKGFKMLDEDELMIEDYIDHGNPFIKTFGKITLSDDVKKEYLSIYNQFDLKPTSLKIGFDSANGATYQISREIIDKLNPASIQINGQPDGRNVNVDSGSTHPEAIINLVKSKKLDIGFSFDGDGDRILVVDSQGTPYDGDMLIYIIGSYLKKINKLSQDTVVLTKMSNPGILKALTDQKIKYSLTDVGDKYVADEMLTKGYIIGGESSGHIILSHLLHSGDGLLVAIYLLQILSELNKSLPELIKSVVLYPIKTINIKNINKAVLKKDSVISKVTETKEKLGQNSLLLVRASGTEPLVRVTISSKDPVLMNELANQLVLFIQKEGETL
jgi:phosphoglucosamine mutase